MTHSYTARKQLSEETLALLTKKGATIINVVEKTISKRGEPLKTKVVFYVTLKSLPGRTHYLSYGQLMTYANSSEEAS